MKTLSKMDTESYMMCCSNCGVLLGYVVEIRQIWYCDCRCVDCKIPQFKETKS